MNEMQPDINFKINWYRQQIQALINENWTLTVTGAAWTKIGQPDRAKPLIDNLTINQKMIEVLTEELNKLIPPETIQQG